MKGHLFATLGDLRRLACDAILVPSGVDSSGRPGELSPPWDGLGIPVDHDNLVAELRPGDSRVAGMIAGSGASPAIWVGHTGDEGRDTEWYAAAITEFVQRASRPGREPRPLGDKRPLLAAPLVGTGPVGSAIDKGEVVKAIVRRLLELLETVEADVVLVLNDPASYAAVQHARLRYGEGRLWERLSAENLETVQRLATEAVDGRLVLFMGAGTGIGAGLLSWSDLLAELATEAGMTDKDDLDELAKLDPRDAAAIIEGRLRRDGKDLSKAISARVAGTHVSLLHQLLASLPAKEALTTNYDTLFEEAWRDAGRTPAVLPRTGTAREDEWLLKLHGSVDDATHPLVLSRADYLRFEGEGAALAGVVHAMLLTRHLLFVGYSLSDDNFHRIVHQVRTTVRAVGDGATLELGTVLTPERPKLIHEVWEPELRLCCTATGPEPEHPVRRLAMVLDRLGAETAALGHLLDDSYKTVFRPDELRLRDQLRALRDVARDEEVRPVLQAAVLKLVAQFGHD